MAVIKILGKNVVFLHGPEAAGFYLTAAETEISFLQGVDLVLGPFLPTGTCQHLYLLAASSFKMLFPVHIRSHDSFFLRSWLRL